MTIGKLWKPVALSVGLCLAVGLRAASAQTVWVRNAAPGSTAELMLNTDKVATGVADASGLVQLTIPPSFAKDKDAAADRHVYVEECGNLRRVLLVDVGLQPPPTDGLCQRTAIPALFETRSITTFVVDATGSHTVLIRQGPAFDAWLHPVLDESGNVKTVREPLPRGLMISGAATGAKFSDVVSVACGDASPCSGTQVKIAPTAAVTYWVTRFLAAEGTFMKPLDVHTSGSGTNYTFDSVFRSRIATVAGKLGIHAGPTRIYATVGADYADTTASTTQTVTPSPSKQGGTETFALKTQGWGLLWGGGMEGWLSQRLAIYAEGGRAALKGNAVDNGDGALNDHLTFVTLGVRFRLGL
jgi:hypothetical protein